jgi:hypothetical protein
MSANDDRVRAKRFFAYKNVFLPRPQRVARSMSKAGGTRVSERRPPQRSIKTSNNNVWGEEPSLVFRGEALTAGWYVRQPDTQRRPIPFTPVRGRP